MKVIYVGGHARSGSTLVGRVLGETAGAICVGETTYLASRGLLENVECGCGVPFRQCAFWSAVGEEAFGGWGRVDVERIVEIDGRLGRHPTLPLQLSVAGRSSLVGPLGEYAAWLEAIFAAIVAVSGAEVIVDTSKTPWFAGVLTHAPSVDLRILHLVRDSRAVAYSWTRSRLRPSPQGERNLMSRFRPAETAMQWMASNASFHLLGRSAVAYARVNYESFVSEPSRALGSLGTFAGSSLSLPETTLRDAGVRLGEHHIFSGNPMRSSSGWLEMHVDDEWRAKLSPRHSVVVTAITWPLLRTYGYPTRPHWSESALGRPQPERT
jgi:hypothetical protein